MRAAAGLRRLLSSSAAASHPRVRVTRGADGVVQVTLARADKLNALDMDMFRQIRDAAQSLIGDTAPRRSSSTARAARSAPVSTSSR